MSAASTAPMPPGVGATDETAEPTRYTTPMLAMLTPPPKASTERTRAAMYASVRTADPPNSSSSLSGRRATSAMPCPERRRIGSTRLLRILRPHGSRNSRPESASTAVSPTSTVWPEGRKSIAPAPLRPAHSRKRNDRAMCMSSPESCCRPMLDEATARSMPCFWRKRTLVAIPPTRAGVMRLTNEPASWAPNVPKKGTCPGTAPMSPIAAAT